MVTANLSLTGLLASRWVASGHFPLSNLFESLLFLSWGLTVSHLILERISNVNFIGVITSPMSLLTNAFASFTLPHEMQKTTALIPALQSNWLMMHVTVMMMSYVALISGSLLSIAFLIINHLSSKEAKSVSPRVENFFQSAEAIGSSTIRYPGDLKNNAIACQDKPVFSVKPQFVADSTSLDFTQCKTSATVQQESIAYTELSALMPSSLTIKSKNHVDPQFSRRQLSKTSYFDELTDFPPFAQVLDNLSYRTLGLGFSLLTIGILSGAVWANEAWGSYWSWDPKETWAFITWLVFAIYLHSRLGKGWKGTKPAAIATTGFFVVWICYLGVNLLGTGLHSYGWLRSGG